MVNLPIFWWNSDKEEIKSEVQEQATEFKLPPYLAFIVNGLYYVGSYPVAFVCKTYSVICFVINIPSLTYAWLKYLTYELPLNFLEKSVKFAKEVPDNIEFSKNFTDEDFEVCFMEFDKDGSGSIQKDEIFDLCKKLMSPDPCLGEYHFPEFSLFDINEYLVRLANQTSTYGIRFNIWLTQE